MNLKAIILDVDGTLADTEDAHRIAFNKTFAENSLPWGIPLAVASISAIRPSTLSSSSDPPAIWTERSIRLVCAWDFLSSEFACFRSCTTRSWTTISSISAFFALARS